ncbi:hypothetical protein [Methylobacterium indicum]|uniref:Uncharacterized protein n=1 Tax=Methylobacterium indicum TaxID=1775910 RepID=A0A8H9C6Z5_9HYPH|nr:hypothetical protein [Methylobacterium indicum]BCM83840.1 hypothetical protein mvi_23010 [Methylobacterium indicum]
MRKNLLSSASTLALTIHVFAPFGMMAGAQAQSMVTFGPHQFQINRQQGASGTAGPDNVQPACNNHQAPPKDNTLIPGRSGQRTAPINQTVTYGPANPTQVYDGDLVVVGTTGG